MNTSTEIVFSPKEEARRNEIIASSAAIFFQKGFSRTSMDDIIAAAGGSKRTLYKYFSSKDALFFAVIISMSDRAMQGLTLQHTDDFRQTLTAFGTGYLKTLVSPDGLSIFRAVVSEAPHLPKLGEEFIRGAPKRIANVLATYISEQNRIERVVSKDTVAAAEQFLALVRGRTHIDALLTGKKVSSKQIKTVVEDAVDTFLRGVNAEAQVGPIR